MPKLTPPSVNCKNSFIWPPSAFWPPSRAVGPGGPPWLREAGPRHGDTATAPGAPYAAFGPVPAAALRMVAPEARTRAEWEAGPRHGDTATAPGAPYAAFGPVPAAALRMV